MLDINKIKEEGNSILITTYPAIGIVALTGFTELTTETSSDYFDTRSFRYSTNGGVDWSNWQDLIIANITTLTFDIKDIVVFEINYTRNIIEGISTINTFNVIGATDSSLFQSEYYDRSIFSYFFTNIDIELLEWTINVLQKMYYEGLLAKFISRENINNSNEDFIILWRTIAHFYAYYVIYARKFERFYENRYLLTEFLKQRGITTDPGMSLSDLQILMSRFSHQIFNRGTNHINDKKNEGSQIDGEILRLIQYNDKDEYLFNLHKTEHFGWNLGNSSPLYRGLYLNDNLQKYKPDVFIPVDYRNDYEFSFFIQTDKKITITFDVKDKDGNLIELKSHKDGTNTNKALLEETLYRSDKAVFIRVVLYNSSKPIFSQDTLNINIGNDLILTPETVEVLPKVIDDQGNVLEISSVKFLPLITPYSHGIVQVYNWISCWIEKNNDELSLPEVKAFIRKYLIPYNSHIELIDLISKKPYQGIDDPITTTTRRLGWRGIQPACQYTIETRQTIWIGGDFICEDFVERLGWRGQEESSECIQETTTTTTQIPSVGFGDIVLVYQGVEYQEWQSWTGPAIPIDMTQGSILDFSFRNKSTGETIQFTEAYSGAPGLLAMNSHKWGDPAITPIINNGPIEGEILVYGGSDRAAQINKNNLSGTFIIYITQIIGYYGGSPLPGTLQWVVNF